MESIDTLSLSKIIEYVLTDCCNCITKECIIDEIKHSKLYRPIRSGSIVSKRCNVIRTARGKVFLETMGEGDYKKVNLVKKIINTFVNTGLLTERGNYGFYLLDTNKRLAWNNIKYLIEDDIKSLSDAVRNEIVSIFSDDPDDKQVLLYVKCVFWYFRKAVVDSFLSDIINYKKKLDPENITAISVGSIKMSSDYDITIEASYSTSSSVIEGFNKLFTNIFKRNAETTFDTNIYGVSFIKTVPTIRTGRSLTMFSKEDIKSPDKIDVMINKALSVQAECSGYVFKYINPDEKDRLFNVSQNIWAYIKLLLKMNMIQHVDDKLYDSFYKELQNAFSKNVYYGSALQFINKYDIDQYSLAVHEIDSYIQDNIKSNTGIDEKYLIGNFISFVNYNGSETYLTNGAFIDVVVNNQLCAKKVVDLNLTGYFDSFIENMSELINHYHRKKYLDRAKSAFDNILVIQPDFEKGDLSKYITNTLTDISKIQVECGENIIKCNSFLLMFYCIRCIILVSNRYTEYVGNQEIEGEYASVFNKIRFPYLKKEMSRSSLLPEKDYESL